MDFTNKTSSHEIFDIGVTLDIKPIEEKDRSKKLNASCAVRMEIGCRREMQRRSFSKSV